MRIKTLVLGLVFLFLFVLVLGLISCGGGDGSGVGIGGDGWGTGEVGSCGFTGGCVGVVGVCGVAGVSLGVADSVGLIGGDEGNSTQATNNSAVLRAVVRSRSEIFFCRIKCLGDIANLLMVPETGNLNYTVIAQTDNSYLVR